MKLNIAKMLRKFIALSLVLGFTTFATYAQDVAQGEAIFKAQCAACHKVKGNLIGPQLAGVSEKYANDMEWLYKWIQNAPALIASGDAKAVALYEQYKSKGMMQAFPNLTTDQIDNILAWVDVEANPAPEPGPNPGDPVPGNSPLTDPAFYYALLALVGVLALIALMLVFITATLVTAVRSKENAEPFSWGDVFSRAREIGTNKFVITAFATIIFVAGLTDYIAESRKIGLHQGYMPEQPIKFSHKLHAGQYEIDCQYCHTGVTKGKSAWIPSSNVCMNCHKYIQEGPQYGTEEIAKIYEAYGWDPDLAERTGEGKPIEWVRIHNLPDHAYFNHAQHVAVGGLECQTCHGQIQEMEVVYQYSNLGMGWCIECHRQEKVKVLGKETDMTVADMGGLNCARCHY